MIFSLAAASALLSLVQVSLATVHVAEQPQRSNFPVAEDLELLAVASLSTAESGEIARYVLRRGFGYNIEPTARIVQAGRWLGHPRILTIELAKEDNIWHIVERREAAIQPVRYNRLVENLAAAASVVGERPNSYRECSHSDYSRFDLNVPILRMRLSRGAHCSDDAPAVIAGELLIAAVELNLRLNWSPE